MLKEFEIEKLNSNFEIRKDCALLNHCGSGDLEKNIQIFKTPEEIIVYAATDRGIGKEENHDRVIINTDVSQFTVLDGMGSAAASQILAEKIIVYPNDLKKALEEAKIEMRTCYVKEGTCLISAKLTPEKTLKVYQVGDCGAIVFGSEGTVKFSATNQVKTYSQVLEVDMKDFGIKKSYQKLVETSPDSFISGFFGNLHEYPEIQLVDEDIVFLFSDVLWCNFSIEELSKLVAQNKNPQNLFRTISEKLKQKMQSADILSAKKYDFPSIKEKAQCYYGGDYVPHRDDQSLVLFQV